MDGPIEIYPEQFSYARFDCPTLSCMYMRSTNTVIDLEINGKSAAPNHRDIDAWYAANEIILKVMK